MDKRMKNDGPQSGLCSHIIQEVQANPSIHQTDLSPGGYRKTQFNVRETTYVVVQRVFNMGKGIEPIYMEACYQEVQDPKEGEDKWHVLDEEELAMLYAGLNAFRQIREQTEDSETDSPSAV